MKLILRSADVLDIPSIPTTTILSSLTFPWDVPLMTLLPMATNAAELVRKAKTTQAKVPFVLPSERNKTSQIVVYIKSS